MVSRAVEMFAQGHAVCTVMPAVALPCRYIRWPKDQRLRMWVVPMSWTKRIRKSKTWFPWKQMPGEQRNAKGNSLQIQQ